MDKAAIQKIIPKLNTVKGASALLDELGYGEFLEPEPIEVEIGKWHVKRRASKEFEPLAKSACVIATPTTENRLYSYFYELNDGSCDRFGRIKITAFRPIAEKHASDAGVPLIFFAPPKSEKSDEVVLATFTKLGKIGGEDRIALRWVRFHRDNPNARTPLDVLDKLPFDKARRIPEIILSAFALEPLTDKFYHEYKDIFDNLKANLVAQLAKAKVKDQPEERAHEFASLLMNRLMFLWFVQKKGWLDGKQDYLLKLFDQYNGKNFYNDRVQHVFSMLNEAETITLRKKIQNNYGFDPGQLPFLNGGLFDDLDAIEQTSRDKAKLEIDNRFFKDIFHNLFEVYNFTVEESTPQNIEIAVDPEMLGHVFEQMVTGRHESGSYYTPKQVVNFMCKEAIKGYLRTQTDETETAISALVDTETAEKIGNRRKVSKTLEKLRVCDPACGSGAYLLGMLHNLIELQRALYKEDDLSSKQLYDWKLEMISQSIYGVDIDPFAVSIAKLRLWLSLVVDETRDPLSSNKPDVALPNLEFKIEVGDSLTAPDPSDREYSGDMFQMELLKLADELGELKDEFLRTHDSKAKDALRGKIHSEENRLRGCLQAERKLPANAFDWRVEFAEVFRKEGFDIIIANPPYIQLQIMPNSYKDILKGMAYETYRSTGDIYCLFYERAMQLLKPKGILTFITSNKWMRADYGSNLRAFFVHKTAPEFLIDFAGVKVFDATVDTNIISLRKSTGAFKLPACRLGDDFRLGQNIREYFGKNKVNIAPEGDESWVVASPEEMAIRRKIERLGTPLKDWDIAIYRGVLTGYNEAFIIDNAKREELIAKDPKSAEIIKPLLRGRDIKKFRADWKGLWLIATFPALHLDINKYPAVRDYLKSFGKRLEQSGEKGCRKKTSNKWFETQDTIAYLAEFEKEKIVWSRLMRVHQSEDGNFPRFSYAQKGIFTLDSLCFVTGDNLYALVGILNSSIAKGYYYDVVPVLDSGGFQMRQEYIQAFKVPSITKKNKTVFQNLNELVKQIVSKLKDPDADTAALEAKIDLMVYKLYELTYDEVLVIDPNFGMSREEYGMFSISGQSKKGKK